MVAAEDYSGSSCTKVADASSGTNEDETDDTTDDDTTAPFSGAATGAKQHLRERLSG